MSNLSARLGLPLLIPGQGQKDVTHNEALAMLDMLVQPVVLSASEVFPPEAVADGQCWLIPGEATGPWTGRGGAVACWTSGGWRFATPSEGWTVWVIDEQARWRLHGGGWVRDLVAGAGIASPSGGAVVDTEARFAIDMILDGLRASGMIQASPG